MRIRTMRFMPVACFLLALPSTVAAQSLSEGMAQEELAKMEGLSAEEQFSRAKTTFTMYSMEALAPVLEAYRNLHGRYPRAGELAAALGAELAATKDKWGTELRYVVSNDGASYRLVSAGGDRHFDESSWTREGALASDDEDAVLANGVLVRMWTDATRPGFGARAALKPAARGLLTKADALAKEGAHAGALQAYIDAVKADSNAASLEAIAGYSPANFFAAPAPPPPPPPPPPAPGAGGARTAPAAAPAAPAAQAADASPLQIAALRQFLALHPDDVEATTQLVTLLPAAEAAQLADQVVKARPTAADSYKLRGLTYANHGRAMDALIDFEKASALDPSNPERLYTVGVVAYEIVAKPPSLAPDAKRAMIARGLAALERAESLRADYAESMTYRTLLLRQRAELETDPDAKAKWIAEADALRAKVVETFRKRSR